MRVRLSALLALLLSASVAHASVSLITRPGGWCDVVAGPGGALTFVRAVGPTIIAERADGTLRWSVTLAEPSLYLRAAADPADAVEAIVQGNSSGDAYVLSAAGARGLGGSFGQNAVAIGWTPARGFIYFVQTLPASYRVYDHAGCAPCAGTWPASSQGFRDILPDGTIVRGDDAFVGTFNGRTLWEPMTRGAITVGQGDPAAIYANVRTADFALIPPKDLKDSVVVAAASSAVAGFNFTVIPGDGFEPHVALLPTGFAVAARTGAGAALAIVTPPYPVDTPPVSHPPPAAPTTPPVTPPATAPTSSAPDEAATVKALAEQHPAELAQMAANSHHCDAIRPQLGEDSPDVQACERITNDLKGKLTRYVAYGLYTTRDHRWGLLAKTGGTNAMRPADGVLHATDIVMWRDDGQVVDIFSDFGVQWGLNPADHHDVTQWIQPLPEDGPGLPPPPPPPPAPTSDLEARVHALEVRVADLVTQNADLRARLDTIAAVPPPASGVSEDRVRALIAEVFSRAIVSGKTSNTFGHQHTVNLRVTFQH